MSTAVYPLGFQSYNNRLPTGGYKSWKGTGENRFPVGTTATHIRPLTNKDPGNWYQSPFGKARPLKHYRKGVNVASLMSSGNGLSEDVVVDMDRNANRRVRSSVSQSLGGGGGGYGLMDQMLAPGQYQVSQNPPSGNPETNCETCQGLQVVDSYKPNVGFITEDPSPNCMNAALCCNAQKKARQRVLGASTNLSPNYYTTIGQYLQNRCQTYDQRVFNFVTYSEYDPRVVKPGGPLATANLYVANCQPNTTNAYASEIELIAEMMRLAQKQGLVTSEEVTAFYQQSITKLVSFVEYIRSLPEQQRDALLVLFDEFISNPYYGMPLEGPANYLGCKLVVYKPNNYQYAQQGAVSSSCRTLKQNVTTIEKSILQPHVTKFTPCPYKQCVPLAPPTAYKRI